MELGDSVWWDASWNPVLGCKPVDAGCRNCYAAWQAGTLHQQAGPHRQVALLYAGIVDEVNGRHAFNGKLTAAPDESDVWTWPWRWKGAAEPVMGPGQPSLIFVVDMGDLLIETRPIEQIDKVIGVMAASDHIGLVLSRRPHVMAEYFAEARWSPTTLGQWKRKLWLGFSCPRQREFDLYWNHMRPLAGADWTVFVSIAPMLGPVRLPDDFLALGDRGWVICSGEQGAHERCRDMDPDWARALRDQCRSSGVAYFTKQMSRKAPIAPDLWSHRFPRVRQG